MLFNTSKTLICPSSYNVIFNGCYKVNTDASVAWSNAHQYCINDPDTITINKTDYITHLIALESAAETRSLMLWMKAWGIKSQFWTDGVVSSSSWNWSNQSITWHFDANHRTVGHNGSHYRIVYNLSQDSYNIVDDVHDKLSHFICEYQDQCERSNACQNNATCYLNFGRELCICRSGFTGALCEQQIDECLSSPCQHGGKCIDQLNNYTCDCSNIFFNGSNCETPVEDPTQSQRLAAFWSIFGVALGLIVLITLSDLPWNEIFVALRCPWYQFKCCSNVHGEEDEDIDRNSFHSTDSPASENSSITRTILIPGTSTKGVIYHVMNTVWSPEQLHHDISFNPQYNVSLIRSPAPTVMEKQNDKESENKHIYATNIIEKNNSMLRTTDTVNEMINWTQQIQEQLKNKQDRPTSTSSVEELIQLERINTN